jgi:hypothetical protein
MESPSKDVFILEHRSSYQSLQSDVKQE